MLNFLIAEIEMQLWKGSLKYKFIAALVIFTALLSFFFGAISIRKLSTELEKQLEQRGQKLADDLVMKFSSPTLDLTESLKIINFLISEKAKGDILYIQVVESGKFIVNTKDIGPPIEDISSEYEVRRGRLVDGTPYLDIKRALPGMVRINILLGKIEQGPSYVRLGLSLAYVQTQIRRTLALIAAVSLGFIAVGVLVAFSFYKMILGPVEILMESVKRFKYQSDARAEVKSGDELEALAQEFNKMADSIAERDRMLQQMNLSLQEANRAKSEFLAIMSHELKTPLHSIRGFSQLLLEEIDGPVTVDQRKDIESILKSGDHLLELIDNILRWSVLEAGEEKLHLEEVEGEKLVEEALQNVRSLAREKDIVLESEMNSIKLRADATKLKQVLINLLNNAVKYTNTGKVKVKALERESDTLFAVEDTGRGIAAEHQEKIFEPFTQIDSSATREFTGIGLGLAIVKKYVEMHGGKVWLESKLGEGSTFYFTIPKNSGGESA